MMVLAPAPVPLLDFLVAAGEAALWGSPPPSRLPALQRGLNAYYRSCLTFRGVQGNISRRSVRSWQRPPSPLRVRRERR